MTNHEALMSRLAGVCDLPEDVLAALLNELDAIAARNEMNLKEVQEFGYQDFAGWPYPEDGGAETVSS